MSTFPRLRLRDPAIALVDLPWEQPLADWPAATLAFRELPVGPSRHLVRFLVADGVAVRPEGAAARGRPARVRGPAPPRGRRRCRRSRPAGHRRGAGARQRDPRRRSTSPHSLQYRRLLMRLPPGPSVHRERLLDAMAFLLVDLHRNGVYWGDCSLANTLFRRDGDRIQAYLVDAETSEVHPALSDGQREYDVEILVENVAFGLADLAAMQDAPDPDEAIAAAERVRDRYRAVWAELHDEPILRRRRPPGDPGPRPAAERPGLLGRRRPRPDAPARPSSGSGCTSRPAASTPARSSGGRGSGRSRARPSCCSTTSTSTRAWLEHTRGGPDRPGRGGRPLAARRLPADARPDRRRRRAGPGPRPGVLRRARAEVVPVRGGRPRRRARPGDRGVRGPRGARAGDGPRPATATRSVALDLERLAEPTTADAGSMPRRRSIARFGVAPSHHDDDRRRARTPSSASTACARRTATTRAVDGVSFEVRPGEVFGLLGPNGAGKTTTVEVLEGLREPDGGEVTVLGVDVVRQPDALKARIGVSLQTAALYPKLTVVEVLDLFADLLPEGRARRRADRADGPRREAHDRGRRTSRAASASACRWRSPSSTTRSSSSSTSRRRAWTRPPGGRCGTSSPACGPRAARSS